VLAENFKRRGFSCGGLLALRVLSEGIESALTTVLLAYYMAIEDTRQEWKDRSRGVAGGGVVPRSADTLWSRGTSFTEECT
jgi:hypothetical protein